MLLKLYYRFLFHLHPHEKKYEKKMIVYDNLKKQTEFLFTTSMALLLIFLFNPRNPKLEYYLNKETKFLFFLLGIILLLSNHWDEFFTNSFFLQYFKDYNRLR
jgi:hypothetical protein